MTGPPARSTGPLLVVPGPKNRSAIVSHAPLMSPTTVDSPAQIHIAPLIASQRPGDGRQDPEPELLGAQLGHVLSPRDLTSVIGDSMADDQPLRARPPLASIPPMRRLRWIVVLVVAVLAAAVIAALLLVRPDLDDGRSRVDARWTPLRPALIARYDVLDGVATGAARRRCRATVR